MCVKQMSCFVGINDVDPLHIRFCYLVVLFRNCKILLGYVHFILLPDIYRKLCGINTDFNCLGTPGSVIILNIRYSGDLQ